MNIIYHISPSSVVENCTIKVYEPQLDGSLSEVRSIAKNAPHTSATTITINGLDRVTHVVKMTGDITGALYHFYDVAPTADFVTIFDPIFFKMGDGGANTPAIGATSYLNSNLAGLTVNDLIFIRNGSVKFPDVDYNVRSDGGINLLLPGDVFGNNDQVVLMRKPTSLTRVVNDSVVGKQFGATDLNADMFVDITSATDYEPAHLRKLIRLNGSAAVYTFSNSEVPPIGYVFRVCNFGSAGVTTPNPKVVFGNAQLLWGATNKTEVDMPFGSVCEFVFDGTFWNASLPIPITYTVPRFTQGSTHLGDVANGDVFTIEIPDQGNTSYFPVLELISNGNAFNDNSVNVTIIGSTKTSHSFQVIAGEIAFVAQNVTLAWMIIKI